MKLSLEGTTLIKPPKPNQAARQLPFPQLRLEFPAEKSQSQVSNTFTFDSGEVGNKQSPGQGELPYFSTLPKTSQCSPKRQGTEQNEGFSPANSASIAIPAGWSGGCAHQGEMQAAEQGGLPIHQGFQGYKTPSHPSCQLTPSLPIFPELPRAPPAQGRGNLTSSVSPGKVAGGDRDG